MSLGFLFSPGWSFCPEFFKPLAAALSDYRHVYLEDKPDLSKGTWIGIGHSLGFSRLLSLPLQGFVSLSGFVRFCAHSPLQVGTSIRVMDRMITKFETDPKMVLKDFYKKCALENPLTDPFIRFNKKQLLDDLKFMKKMDLTSKFRALNVPVLVLAAKDDLIVPFALTKETFDSYIALEKGGHGFGYTHADWCAIKIKSWIFDAP